MNILSRSELLFYGGIVIMILAIVLAVLSMILLVLKKRRLNTRLEQEYGKLQR